MKHRSETDNHTTFVELAIVSHYVNLCNPLKKN